MTIKREKALELTSDTSINSVLLSAFEKRKKIDPFFYKNPDVENNFLFFSISVKSVESILV